jgi:peptidoglycan/LPS O-acetylase OafA/YrhL
VRIKELDGLRGIAVLAVVDSHYLPWIPAAASGYGWLGVDLFFILSGFLITGILLDLRQEKRYFAVFYTRRALRILPPYFLGLAVYAAVSIALGMPGTLSLWLSLIFYYSSLIPGRTPIIHGTAFGVPIVVRFGISVLWSLSVEEVYYTVWAPIIRFFKEWALASALAVMIVVAPYLRMRWYSTDHAQLFNFYCRMDGLAFGSAVALLIFHRRQSPQAWLKTDRILNWVTILVLAASAIFWMTFKGDPNNPRVALGISFADLSFALLTYALVRYSGSNLIWVRIFRAKWLRSVGMISYSLYLFHCPLLVLSQNMIGALHLSRRANAVSCVLLGLVLSFAVAYGLWYGMESRILRWKDRKVPSPAHPSDALADGVESPQPASVS